MQLKVKLLYQIVYDVLFIVRSKSRQFWRFSTRIPNYELVIPILYEAARVAPAAVERLGL